VIAVRDDIDGDADALRGNELHPRMMDRLDQPSPELLRILEIEREQARGRAGLIERVDRLDKDPLPVRQEEQLRDRFPRRKQKCPLVEVYLDLVFWLELRHEPRGWIYLHGLYAYICWYH
jgi:hypothetical protein